MMRGSGVGGQQLKTVDPSVYLLSPDQMFEQNYPTPSTLPQPLPTGEKNVVHTFEEWKKEDGWVEAPYKELEEGKLRKVFGLDCEMVRSLFQTFQLQMKNETESRGFDTVLDGRWI